MSTPQPATQTESWSDLAEAMTALSDTQVAARRRPARRMLGSVIPGPTRTAMLVGETHGRLRIVHGRREVSSGEAAVLWADQATVVAATSTRAVYRLIAAWQAQRLHAGSGRGEVSDRHRAAKQVEFHLGLSTSGRVVVIPEALARQFWTPTTVTRAGATMQAWAGTLGLAAGVAGAAQALRLLTGDLLDDKQVATMSRNTDRAALAGEDMIGPMLTQAAASAVMGCAEQVMSAWASLQHMDPVGRREAVARGDGCVATSMACSNDIPRAVLSTPCRFKPGATVQFFDRADGRRLGKAVLTSIDYGPDGLVGTFTSSAARRGADSRGVAWLSNTAPDQRSYMLPEARPMGDSRRRESRWDKPVARVRRDVPTDVSMGGL